MCGCKFPRDLQSFHDRSGIRFTLCRTASDVDPLRFCLGHFFHLFFFCSNLHLAKRLQQRIMDNVATELVSSESSMNIFSSCNSTVQKSGIVQDNRSLGVLDRWNMRKPFSRQESWERRTRKKSFFHQQLWCMYSSRPHVGCESQLVHSIEEIPSTIESSRVVTELGTES